MSKEIAPVALIGCWYVRQFSVNANKDIIFIKKKKLKNFYLPKMREITPQLPAEVKHLGVFLKEVSFEQIGRG